MKLGSLVKVLATSKACPGVVGGIVDTFPNDLYLVGLSNGNQHIVHVSKLEPIESV